jgi:hypothetical protein
VHLYFGGAEIGSHRTILQDLQVKNVAMSYMGLRRRVKFSKPWLIEEKFEDGVSVFLDSGAYTINQDADADPDELIEIFEHYKTFVMDNLDHIEMVSEFDALPLGMEWIEEQRDGFWSTIPREKFMAIWHPVWGIPYLHEMASRFEIIGIPATSLEGRNLRPILNALAAKGTRLHGVAMTKIEEMQSIRWDSVASTSWISPQRYGDTIVWTGNELKRYPRKYKDQARKRHRTLFKDKGFDADAIANDDSTEVLRLSVWSWRQFEDYVNNHHRKGGVVTPLFSSGPPPIAENPEDEVDTQVGEPGSDVPTPETSKAVAKVRETTSILPVMGLGKAHEDDEDDSNPVVTIRSESARVCNTCFLAEKCPAYEPDSNCAYNIPISVRTREQFKALNYGMLEMQAQRVMFMRFAEEAEGGYADPNLSKEISLLNKMSAQIAEMEREGFSLTISAKGSGPQGAESGMISRIFGSNTGQKVQELEGGPIQADAYIDAEIIEDDGRE